MAYNINMFIFNKEIVSAEFRINTKLLQLLILYKNVQNNLSPQFIINFIFI